MPEKKIFPQKTRFTTLLMEANGLDPDGFESWLFCPGMRFGSLQKWWGDQGQRDFPHEGIDFCLYRDGSQRIHRLDDRTRIPAMHSGVVRAMFTDYLGQAIIIEHQHMALENRHCMSVYAHTTPGSDIRVGKILKTGDIVATIADTRRSKANILPHLHFSLGIPAPDFSYEPFVWNLMRDPDRITLLDPTGVIERPWETLDAGDAVCNGL
jgi:murein DD-endopeptidase MepM/ murein hydrolase activator NlpD